MSLMARIRRTEARLEWLQEKGPLRFCALQLKMLEQRAEVEARLKANPRNEKARRMATMLGLALPPLPEPLPEPRPGPLSGPRPLVVRPPPFRDERVRDSSFADTTFANVVRVPPPSWPPPPLPSKPPPEQSYDIPEHMQVRPVHWRQRNASDVDDWDDDDRPGYGQCLTEYDPIEEV